MKWLRFAKPPPPGPHACPLPPRQSRNNGTLISQSLYCCVSLPLSTPNAQCTHSPFYKAATGNFPTGRDAMKWNEWLEWGGVTSLCPLCINLRVLNDRENLGKIWYISEFVTADPVNPAVRKVVKSTTGTEGPTCTRVLTVASLGDKQTRNVMTTELLRCAAVKRPLET